MSGKSRIEWTDATWNPVVGCSHVSPACDHCYAERMACRQIEMGNYDSDVIRDGRWSGQLMLRSVKDPTPSPKMVFVGSMTDLFHEHVPFAWLDQIWAVMGCCDSPDMRRVTFQILTKRPARMLEYARYRNAGGMMFDLPNLWLGVTAEDQQRADERIPLLLQCPAAVRFVSAEPMLGPLDLESYLSMQRCPENPAAGAGQRAFCDSGCRSVEIGHCRPGHKPVSNRLDWVIAGGETGPSSRPMHPDWPRSLRDQCQAAGTPFFFKSWGDWGSPSGADAVTLTHWVCTASHVGEIDPAHIGKHRPGCQLPTHPIRRVGKKASGRLLNGHEYSEFPKGAIR